MKSEIIFFITEVWTFQALITSLILTCQCTVRTTFIVLAELHVLARLELLSLLSLRYVQYLLNILEVRHISYFITRDTHCNNFPLWYVFDVMFTVFILMHLYLFMSRMDILQKSQSVIL